jgi:hypothetical protein
VITGVAFGETVTWLHRTVTGQDAHGNDITTWVETTIGNCALAPRATFEDVQARDMAIFGLTLYTPPGYAMEPADRIKVAGNTYEIDGPVADWYNPLTASRGGVQVSISHITG